MHEYESGLNKTLPLARRFTVALAFMLASTQMVAFDTETHTAIGH